MDFAGKLHRALELLEAKAMVHDNMKPLYGANVEGWNVLIYDGRQTPEKIKRHEQISKHIEDIKDKATELAPLADDTTFDKFHSEMMNASEKQYDLGWERLRQVKDVPARDTDPKNKGKLEESYETVCEGFLDQIMRFIGLNATQRRLLDLYEFEEFVFDSSESWYNESCRRCYEITTNIRRYLAESIKKLEDEVDTRLNPADVIDDDRVQDVGQTVAGVVQRMRAVGIRKGAAVPIRVHFVNDYPASGFGTTKKAGDQSSGLSYRRKNAQDTWHKNKQDTHHINVFVTSHTDLGDFEEVLIHEVGHTLFSSNKTLQKALAAMAHGQKERASGILGRATGGLNQRSTAAMLDKQDLKAPSHYGSKDYVYSGLTQPGIHHQTGNEWMAEMFKELVAPNGDVSEFSPLQVRLFKMAISVLNGNDHPHAGLTYTAGQDAPGWAPDKEEPVPPPQAVWDKRQNAFRTKLDTAGEKSIRRTRAKRDHQQKRKQAGMNRDGEVAKTGGMKLADIAAD